MKTDLSTFPKCGHLAAYCSWCKWLENFTKELQKIEQCSTLKVDWIVFDGKTYINIKEILGNHGNRS